VSDWGWFVILAAIAGVVFWLVETRIKPTTSVAVSTGSGNDT